MRKIYLFYLMSLLVLGACQRDDVYMASQMSLNESEQREVSVISVSAAERGLNLVLGDLYADTRSGAVPTIIQTELISVSDFIEEEYRDNIPGYDNKFYLATIDEGGGVYGTAIMGATPNLPSILAIINNTEFTLEDCRAAWLNICSEYGVSYEDDTRGTIIDPTDGPLPFTPPSDDVIGLIIGTPSNPNPVIDTQYEVINTPRIHYNILPMLKSKFNQWAPFNNYYGVKPGTNEHYLAGCGIIATAQILAYNKLTYGIGPDRIGAYTIDWARVGSAIENKYNNPEHSYTIIESHALAILCKSIGDQIITDYTTTTTGTNISKVEKFLEDYGYNNVHDWNYDGDWIYTMIGERGLPIYVRGTCTKCGDGHGWVMDGFYQYEDIVTTIKTETHSNGTQTVTEEVVNNGIVTLLHCNMGWGGASDGYYCHRAFDIKKGIYPGPDVDPDDTRSCDEDHNFSENNKIITYTL